MKTIFTEELKKFIAERLDNGAEICDSLGGGLHYTVELSKKIDDEDYIIAKENFFNILNQFKDTEEIRSKIKFIKNCRFTKESFNVNKYYDDYVLDILILPKEVEDAFDKYQF
ncbi:MAG: hypothetical protein ACRC4T_15590 [Cetobacterium sp.]